MNNICIRKTTGEVLAANLYTLIKNGHALVIDPCAPPEDALPDGVVLDAIILTHEHYDHICYANEWATYYSAPIWCGRAAAEGIANPRMNMSHYGRVLFEQVAYGVSKAGEIADYVCHEDRRLKDEETFVWQESRFVVLETPGHSPGSICLLVDDKLLFCGDTLLSDEPTGTRFRGSDKNILHRVSYPKLQSLDESVIVYPGHGSDFRLDEYRFWDE